MAGERTSTRGKIPSESRRPRSRRVRDHELRRRTRMTEYPSAKEGFRRMKRGVYSRCPPIHPIPVVQRELGGSAMSEDITQPEHTRPGHRDSKAHASEQPFVYPLEREFVEPDWRRLPGYADVTDEEWKSAQWQRAHSVKNLVEFKKALGDFLSEELYEDIRRDQEERSTMSMLIPPQMINTMDEHDLAHDPVMHYMAPKLSDRRTDWPGHPMASRDSLHEADMWAVEGLTHRYPTKVLAELIPTCPQYCGHCTRMDLVGNDTAQILKYKFEIKQNERWDLMIDYLKKTPSVRDVVVSGGDMANVPIKRLEDFVMKLLDI